MLNKYAYKVYVQLGLIAIIGMPFYGCNSNADKASRAYAQCVQLDIKGDLRGAWDACNAAIAVDPVSKSGKEAAEKLIAMKPRYDVLDSSNPPSQTPKAKEKLEATFKKIAFKPQQGEQATSAKKEEAEVSAGQAEAKKAMDEGKLQCNQNLCVSLFVFGASGFEVDGSVISREEIISTLATDVGAGALNRKEAIKTVDYQRAAYKLCGCDVDKEIAYAKGLASSLSDKVQTEVDELNRNGELCTRSNCAQAVGYASKNIVTQFLTMKAIGVDKSDNGIMELLLHVRAIDKTCGCASMR